MKILRPLLALAASAFVALAPGPADARNLYATGEANVREGPTTSSKVVGHLSRRGAVTFISGPQGGWYRIKTSNGQVGYLASSMASLSVPAARTVARHGGGGHSFGPGGSGSDYYTNVDGNQVHRPMRSATVPAGATARCNDGTYSFSRHRRGTCSHHGGVAAWL